MFFVRSNQGARFDRFSRGILAGALGGIVAGGMKLLGEAVFPPRTAREPVPPVIAISKLTRYLTGSPLLPQREAVSAYVLHFAFSIGVGALYGLLAEAYPQVRRGHGVGAGLGLLLVTHESLLPALGLSLPVSQLLLKEHLSELSTHALFGLSLETTRRLFRERVMNAHSLARS